MHTTHFSIDYIQDLAKCSPAETSGVMVGSREVLRGGDNLLAPRDVKASGYQTRLEVCVIKLLF